MGGGRATLPGELRWAILEHVAEDYSYLPERRTRAGYSTVCKEWQTYFEFFIWQGLVLDQGSLSKLELYTRNNTQRRDYIRRIWFQIKLEEYDCTVCSVPESSETYERNNINFTAALHQLLSIISKWPRRDPRPGFTQGMILDLGAFSHSDSKHAIRDFRLDESYPYLTEEDLSDHAAYWQAYKEPERLTTGLDPHDCPAWALASQGAIYHGSKERLLGSRWLTLDVRGFDKGAQLLFPTAAIVDAFILRRQYYRLIHPSLLEKLFRDATPGLQYFRHEFWSHPDRSQGVSWEWFRTAYETMISRSLPKTLRTLHLFEDSNPVIHGSPEEQIHHSESLGSALARGTRSLEQVSIAFFTDASYFFSDFWEDKVASGEVDNELPWPKLRTLSLTTTALLLARGPGPKGPDAFDQLLRAIGRAVRLMPKLELLELWNGVDGEGFIFQYVRGEGVKPYVQFWSSSDLLFDPLPQLQLRMEHLLYPIAGRILKSRPGLPKGHLIRSYADVLPHTSLRHQVLDRVSDFQIQLESQHG